MRISVDREKCQAYEQCNMVDSDLFSLDQQGYSDIGTGKEVPPGMEGNAEMGVSSCPVSALWIDSEG
jgi:ferredoxin